MDIAGLVKGASKGEGLGNQFLANIRETDAILHVLRCFDDGNIVHVDGSVDPVRDKEVVDMELQIKDLETVENRIKKVEKQATTGGDKEAKKLLSLLQRYREVLLQGKSCRVVVPENPEEEQMARELYLLTNKPVMYVCNVDEASAATGNAYVDAVRAAVADEHAEILVIAAKTESEIAEIEEYEDRQMFLEEMGLSESGVVRLIQGAYRLLGLQTFFTAGADECRAWTIRVGDKAPKAAGVIHTDFERGFIRAEVIKYDDFVQRQGLRRPGRRHHALPVQRVGTLSFRAERSEVEKSTNLNLSQSPFYLCRVAIFLLFYWNNKKHFATFLRFLPCVPSPRPNLGA